MILRTLLVSLFAFHALACQSKKITPPTTVPVKGIVNLNGKPAAGIRVQFHPQFDIGSIKFIPYGETDSKGEFQLSTGAANNGAPVGEYAVTFEKIRVGADRSTNFLDSELDDFKGKYANPATSAWKIKIANGENNLSPFELEFKKK